MGRTKEDTLQEIIEFCNGNEIYWFNDLLDSVIEQGKKGWLRSIMSPVGGTIITLYLISKARSAGLLSDKDYVEWVDDCITELENTRSKT